MTALQQLCNCGPVWLPWKRFKREDGVRKIAIRIEDGRWASSTREADWTGYRRAEAYLENLNADGLCFNVGLTPFVVFDIDRTEGNERIENFIGWLNSYTEVSPSGKGVHVIVEGTLPDDHFRKVKDFFGEGFPLEVYQTDRYVTFSGAGKGLIQNRQAELDLLYSKRLSRGQLAQGEQVGAVRGKLTDEAILGAIQSREDWSVLWWGGSDDSSNDDWQLCKLLAWLSDDAEQIDRLFRQSGCYRPKWEDRRGRGTYGQLTIEKALRIQREKP